MAKVKYLSGDQKGEVGYLGFHEMQAALQAGAIEVINDTEEQANVGSEEDKDEIVSSKDDEFEGKTKAELLDLAKERNVDVSSTSTKAEIIEALKA
ncbi:hypothetical protein [Microvirga sp. P5_D2]